MTEELTSERIEAAAKAMGEASSGFFSEGSWRHLAREALVAAAGAAPQAESDDCPTPGNHATEEALDHLESLRYKGTVEYADYVALHDLISAITPVQPSSTVDEDALANLIHSTSVNHFGGLDSRVAPIIARAVAEWLKEQGRGSEM